jgi:hypothetical protein
MRSTAPNPSASRDSPYQQVTTRTIPVIALTRRDAPSPVAGAMPAVDVEGGQLHGMRLLGSAP